MTFIILYQYHEIEIGKTSNLSKYFQGLHNVFKSFEVCDFAIDIYLVLRYKPCYKLRITHFPTIMFYRVLSNFQQFVNVLKLFFYPYVDFKALKSALQKEFMTHNFTVLRVAHLVIGSNHSNNFISTLIGEVSHLHFVLRFVLSFSNVKSKYQDFN